MKRIFFDLESNGLLDQMDCIHSLVLMDADTGRMVTAHDQPWDAYFRGPDVEARATISEAVDMLMRADEVIGHNIIKFDIPAIQKLYPWFEPKKVTDTLVISRLLFADMADRDFDLIRKQSSRIDGQQFPSKLIGSHGLKAWGYRLGILKGDFAETTDWAEWSPEMQEYCEQDVRVTAALYRHLMARTGLSEQAVEIEHKFAHIIALQERHGFAFDKDKAVALYQGLVKRRTEIAAELQQTFPPKRVEEVFIPKVNNKTKGYVKGQPFTKVKFVEFNPSSRQMIADRLQEMGWEPTEFTPSGQAKIDETTLQSLPYPEAKLLAEHFLVEKRIGQLAEGEQAWLKLVRQGRIHGSVNTNGAVTGRCTHANPNVAQVPSVGAPYGAECRELFTVRRGYSLVGADLSGLELRCLAHFMARYDGGAYAEIVLHGDVHTANQQAAGLATRNKAKTFIYAFLYGAGPLKLGSIAGVSDEERPALMARARQIMKQRAKREAITEEDALLIAKGEQLKRKFLKGLPALGRLLVAVEAAADRGYLKGLDGRRLHIRSKHAALNVLLQSAGALIAKVATIIAYEDLLEAGLVWGKDFAQVAHIHDEMQFEVREGLEELVGTTVVRAMQKAGEYFNFRCPITGEWKSGKNWKETH